MKCKICGGEMITFRGRDDVPWLICEMLHGRLHPIKKTPAPSLDHHHMDPPSKSDGR